MNVFSTRRADADTFTPQGAYESRDVVWGLGGRGFKPVYLFVSVPDNPFFKLAEHIFVGASVGYLLVITYHEVILKKLAVPLVEQHEWRLVIPLVLGLLMLARFVPRLAWTSRLAFAFI